VSKRRHKAVKLKKSKKIYENKYDQPMYIAIPIILSVISIGISVVTIWIALSR